MEILVWLARVFVQALVGKLLDELFERLKEQKAPKAGKHFRGR